MGESNRKPERKYAFSWAVYLILIGGIGALIWFLWTWLLLES